LFIVNWCYTNVDPGYTGDTVGDSGGNVFIIHTHINDPCKVFPVHVVISLEEHLSEPALADRVVFRVELVETMERVAVLE
jgi:hypothetical protein